MTPNSRNVPVHVGIIMDGNGRWAKKQGLPRTSGHKEGLEAAKRIAARASDRGVSVLSLYTFSTENWRRTEEEVSFLMNLIKVHLRKQYEFYKERRIRIIHSGNIARLPEAVRREILLAENDTAGFNGMKINLLINYGGRDEIVRAVNRCLENKTKRHLAEEDIAANLDHPETPALDFLIRTGGEHRLSNFLLWQAAYAELYFSDIYWPDWNSQHFDEALEHFQSRQRRFGGVPAV